MCPCLVDGRPDQSAGLREGHLQVIVGQDRVLFVELVWWAGCAVGVGKGINGQILGASDSGSDLNAKRVLAPWRDECGGLEGCPPR